MKQKFEWSFAAFTDLASKFPFRIRSCGKAMIRQGSLPKPRTLCSLEVLWCTSGIFQVVFPEGKFTMRQGDVCCYLPGETHIFDAPPGEGGQYRWVAFEGSFSVEFWKRFGVPRTPHYAGECPEEHFAILYDLIRRRDDAGVLEALSEGVKLLILSTRTAHRDKPAGEGTGNEKNYATLARALADLNYTDPRMNVSEIAESLSIHRVHLAREFKRACGTTLSAYLIRRRLACAADLLRNTGLSVKSVAVKSGFSDPAYFTRAFRRAAGVSPQKFREEEKGDLDKLSGTQTEEMRPENHTKKRSRKNG
ncbi:MAG: AraC family transcriptional regulator [Lentisphaeria bacterium]|nr:AraC family transcriptional regulator [Lentisphaeria bacterium]